MKDYKCTKLWVGVITDISEDIDCRIDYFKRDIQAKKEIIANEDSDNIEEWQFEAIEELQEKIKALEWTLTQINAPLKFKK